MSGVTGEGLVQSVAPPLSPKHNVSSPGFGGGPSVHSSGATPGAVITATPPVPSCSRTVVPEGKKVQLSTFSTQTDPFFVGSLSSKTCLELLPLLSMEQLKHELLHRQSHGVLTDFRPTRHTDKSVFIKQLEKCLLAAIPAEYNNVLRNYETLTSNFSTLTSNFSYLADQMQAEVDNLKKMNVPESSILESPVTVDLPSDDTGLDTELTDSVCDLNYSIKFTDLSTESVLQQIPITRRGTYGRYTTYFGSRPYSYGRIHHDPCEYPDIDIFSTIEERMKSVDNDFSFDDYTCLVTHYPNGSSSIPRHSDNEPSIQHDSTIYTISIGATRTLRLTNTTGLLQEHDVTLRHGTVYSMSRLSQDSWSHEIVPDYNCKEPRISFTFRKLTDPHPKASVPPIRPPEPVKPTIAMGSHHRILTDSILDSTPEHIFQRVDKHKCIRKTNYRLTDVFNFEPEFRYSDFVILACGINDLARHGLTAHTLADMVVRRLRQSCDKNPDTTFIFCSILYTGQDWLKRDIDEFNKIMFEVSVTTPNLRFLDTHQALVNAIHTNKLDGAISPQDKHGQHLIYQARKLLSEQLVNAVELTVGKRLGIIKTSKVRGWSWPLRVNFVYKFRQIAANLYSSNIFT